MSSSCSILTPINLYHSSPRLLATIQSSSLFYPHSYQSIPLLSKTPGNNSVLLKYATTHVTVDRGTVHKLRPRLFFHFVVNSLPLQSNPAPFQVTLLLLCTSLTHMHSMCHSAMDYDKILTCHLYH